MSGVIAALLAINPCLIPKGHPVGNRDYALVSQIFALGGGAWSSSGDGM